MNTNLSYATIFIIVVGFFVYVIWSVFRRKTVSQVPVGKKKMFEDMLFLIPVAFFGGVITFIYSLFTLNDNLGIGIIALAVLPILDGLGVGIPMVLLGMLVLHFTSVQNRVRTTKIITIITFLASLVVIPLVLSGT